MPNSITTQTLQDGERNLVVKVDIDGDGSGDETNTALIDISGFSPAPDEVTIERVQGLLNGFSVQLEWDANSNVPAFHIGGDDNIDQSFRSFGGITNDASTGKTGDIDFSTSGLGDEEGSFILWMKKKFT